MTHKTNSFCYIFLGKHKILSVLFCSCSVLRNLTVVIARATKRLDYVQGIAYDERRPDTKMIYNPA